MTDDSAATDDSSEDDLADEEDSYRRFVRRLLRRLVLRRGRGRLRGLLRRRRELRRLRRGLRPGLRRRGRGSGRADPTVPATTVPPTTAPPTTVPPTTVPPTTVPPVAAFSVSVGTSGPAYAGLGVSIPVSVSPAGTTLSLGPGRSVHASLLQQAAAGPTFEMKLPDGVTFASVDDPAWSCSVAGEADLPPPPPRRCGQQQRPIQLSLAANVATRSPSSRRSRTLPADRGWCPPLVIAVRPRRPERRTSWSTTPTSR